MKINDQNYYLSSRGEFKTISSKVFRNIVEQIAPVFTRDYSGKPEYQLMHTSFRYGNHMFTNQVCSLSYYGTKLSASLYFISEDKTHLIRISNHWSEATQHKMFCCGNIASCYWTLSGKQTGIGLPGNSQNHNKKLFYAGIIRLEDLKSI